MNSIIVIDHDKVNKIEYDKKKPSIEAWYTGFTPRNQVGGRVNIRGSLKINYLSAYEWSIVHKYLQNNPEDKTLPVYGVKLEADPGYGISGSDYEIVY